MKAIGGKVADEFSRNFFLRYVTVTGRKVTLIVEGMPDNLPDDVLQRELVGLPAVITVIPKGSARPRAYDLVLAGNGQEGDLVGNGVLKSLNAKLGQPCFSLGRIAGVEVSVVTPETLWRMKRDTVRLKDKGDAERLAIRFGFEEK